MENHLKISKTIRKCQRNWDLSKTIPEEHIQHLAYIAKHAPSKQDEAYFDLVIIKSRNIIDKIHEWSVGFSMFDDAGNPLPSLKNPQTAANILFLWLKKPPLTIRNFYQERWNHNEINGMPKRQDEPSRRDNAYTSIGISTGVTAWAAAELGYVTGFSKNLGESNALKALLNIDLEPTYSLGIGFPDTSLPHNVSHEGNVYNSFSNRKRKTKIYYYEND